MALAPARGASFCAASSSARAAAPAAPRRAAARRAAAAAQCAAAAPAGAAPPSPADAKVAALKPHIDGVPIYLVGMMGSGKSTVGSLLAEKLGYMAFDTDSVIEQATGSSVVSIFESEGEEAFRDMETDVLKQLSPLTRTVICTGGGAVLRSVNWGCMTHGISVWLDVPVATLARRVDAQGADSRPLAAGGDEEGDRSGEGVEAIEKRLEALREERKKSYGQADIHLEVPGAAEPERVCELVLDEMEVRVREVLTKRNMAEIQHDSGGFGIGNINTVQDDSGNGSQPLL